MSKVLISNLEQADATLMQALADAPDNTTFDCIARLLFAGNYRMNGGNVIANPTPDGKCFLQIGDFVGAGGKFFSVLSQATLNILTGTAGAYPSNVWGTGVAANPTYARIDLVCIKFNYVNNTSVVKSFIDPTTTPPTVHSQTVNTNTDRYYDIQIVHGTPSPSPSAPVTPSGYMVLATINVAAGVTTIINANITNNSTVNLSRLDLFMTSAAPNSAATDRLHGNGVFFGYAGALAVTQDSPTPDMGVTVLTGRLVYNSVLTDYTAPSSLSIAPNASGNPRYDLVQVDYITKSFSVVTGTPAPSPTIPAVTGNGVALAAILVANGATQIVTGNITDERLFAPVVGGELEEVPAGAITGSNYTYTLTRNAKNVRLSRNGLVLSPTVDYTIALNVNGAGTVLTLVVAPTAPATLLAKYMPV